MASSPFLRCFAAGALAWLCQAGPALGAGVQPETTVVIVSANDGEASISVRNTDAHAVLLHTALDNIPEDADELLLVTPPVARVEAGQSQLVRFILQPGEPLQAQRLKRVIFEGIPPRQAEGTSQVAITVRQNLPVIIHPRGLPLKQDPWVLLKWQVQGQELVLSNPSPYVVRLASELALLPGEHALSLQRTYVLPNAQVRLPLPPGAAAATAVRLRPASLYGFALPPAEAALQRN